MKLAAICAALSVLRECAGTKRRPPTPVLGFSTWNTFGCAINESLVVEIAEAMVKNGLRDAGYSFINLDDWSVPVMIEHFCVRCLQVQHVPL